MSEESSGAGDASEAVDSTEVNETNENLEGSANAEGGEVGGEEAVADAMEQAIKRYKVKVDGEDQEVDEQELIRNYQLRKASDKRFSEGQQMRKQSEEFIRLLKTDPKKVLAHPSIGIDLKNFAEEYLMGELQQEMMSPEEKQLKEYQAKLSKYEEAERTQKEQAEAKQKEEVQTKYAEAYNKQIIDALETSGLPKTEYTVQRMVHYMHKALKNGYELGAGDVTDLVRRDYMEDSKALFSGLDADALESILGTDIAKKLRKADLNKLKNPQNNLKEPAGVKRSGAKEARKSKKLTPAQWRENIAKITD